MAKKGSILIFTLWILVILVLLSIVLSRHAARDITMAKYESNSIKATYLARAAVMKFVANLTKDDTLYDSLNEDWANPEPFSFANATVFYTVSDENSRLNLNTSNTGNLTRLDIDESIAEKIWGYKEQKIKDGTKGFEFMEELFLVPDMNQEIYSAIKDFVTIYRGTDSKVNINTASEQVLFAVIGDESLVQNILDYRKGDDEEDVEDDGIFKKSADISMIEGLNPSLFSVSSDVFRIHADMSFSEDKKIFKSIEAIVDRAGTILNWRNAN